jgi:ABC-type Mn2+/Zn2+ transport system permease subunit
MSQQFILSFISSIAIGSVAGYIGSLMLQKKMTLIAGPLGHLAFPGVALALLYGFDTSLGAFPFVILGILFVWYLDLKTTIPAETLTAIAFAVGVSIAVIFLPIDKAEEALAGNIDTISITITIMTVILSIIVFITIKKIFNKMVLLNISEDLAKVEGINVKKYTLIYFLAIAIIVALGVKLVGVLLTVALIAIPAATAQNLATSMKSYTRLSILFGTLSPILGLTLSNFTTIPTGILIILSGAFLFLISLLFRKK